MKTERQSTLEKILQEDLATLVEVSEEAILSELYERYKKNDYYTFIGDILLFLNPNKCANLYGSQVSLKTLCFLIFFRRQVTCYLTLFNVFPTVPSQIPIQSEITKCSTHLLRDRKRLQKRFPPRKTSTHSFRR